ncbi:MAG: carbamoyl phosphate synthase small subunit, partial [Flavobacteriaceae bacterium]
ISDVETRALLNYISKNGAMNAVVSTEVDQLESLKEQLDHTPSMEGLELASKVSTKKAYTVGNPEASIKIAALDLGIKKNILHHMVERDMYVKVFPYNSPFETLEAWNPDGYFISNGPGDPEPLKQAQKVAKSIIEKNKPLFGICLGHQVIALANGVPTFKMFNGHRGINHPVKNLLTGKGEITSQNHGFAVEMEAAQAHPDIEITHVHLNDHTLAGMKMKNKNCFSVQYHPEAGPGPNDATYLFDIFKQNIVNALN